MDSEKEIYRMSKSKNKRRKKARNGIHISRYKRLQYRIINKRKNKNIDSNNIWKM